MAASETNATILDVARHAGVSVGTVSYVLNGTKNVSEARWRLVLAAVRELDYVPNRLAQGLRRGRAVQPSSILWVIERLPGWIPRCEKTDISYSAIVSFACTLILVKSIHMA